MVLHHLLPAGLRSLSHGRPLHWEASYARDPGWVAGQVLPRLQESATHPGVLGDDHGGVPNRTRHLDKVAAAVGCCKVGWIVV